MFSLTPHVLAGLTLGLTYLADKVDLSRIRAFPKTLDDLPEWLASCLECALQEGSVLKQAEFEAALNAIRPQMIARILCLSQKHRVSAVSWFDPNYPDALKTIPRPAPLLFFRGNMTDLQPALAIVGSRKMTPYGERLIKAFVPQVVGAGIKVISGMALGIDGLAHRMTLAQGGTTWAVLGCGLDRAYPSQHRSLMTEIVERGCVLSEYAPGTSPLAINFLRRNRLISGLSRAVWVVEAGQHSGTLNTVSHALEQGREVMASPGSVFSETSRGCHHLLAQGATLIQDGEDILRLYGTKTAVQATPALLNHSLPMTWQTILKLTADRALAFDEIWLQGHFTDSSQLRQGLAELELLGKLRNHEGKYFALE